MNDNSIGLRTAATGNVDAAIVACVASSGRSRTDAIICNWKGLKSPLLWPQYQLSSLQKKSKKCLIPSQTLSSSILQKIIIVKEIITTITEAEWS